MKRYAVAIKTPSPEDWENIVGDLKLTAAQERTLKTVLDWALDDISRYHNQPRRGPLVRRLKKFAKALGELRDECRRASI